MDEKEFQHLICVALKGKRASEGVFGQAERRKKYIGQGKWAVSCLEKAFQDTDGNVRKWLVGDECIYRNPKTNEPVRIKIGYDTEALYLFLEYCLKRKMKEPVCDDFFDYLVLTVTRSNCKNWEEC